MDDCTPEDSSSIKQTINIVLRSSSNIDPLKERPLEEISSKEIQVPKNNKIFINYVHTKEILDQNKIIINDVFVFKVTFGTTNSDDEIEPQTIEEYRHRNDWPIWKEAVQIELNSFAKQEVFELVVHTPKGVIFVGYKWIFIRKWNENIEIVQYKKRLVA